MAGKCHVLGRPGRQDIAFKLTITAMFSSKIPIDKEFKNLAKSLGLDPKEVLSVFMSKFVSDLTLGKTSLSKWLEEAFPEIREHLQTTKVKVGLNDAVHAIEPKVRKVLEHAAGAAQTERVDFVSLDRLFLMLLEAFPDIENDLQLNPFVTKRLRLQLKERISNEPKTGKTMTLDMPLINFVQDIYSTYIESGDTQVITLEQFVEAYRINILPTFKLT